MRIQARRRRRAASHSSSSVSTAVRRVPLLLTVLAITSLLLTVDADLIAKNGSGRSLLSLSPAVSLGLRSALARRSSTSGTSSTLLLSKWGRAVRGTSSSSSSPPARSSASILASSFDEGEDEDDSLSHMESAYFYPRSAQEAAEMRSAETAHLRKTVKRRPALRLLPTAASARARLLDDFDEEDEDDELAFLESTVGRHCSERTTMVSASSAASTASTTLNHQRGGAAAAVIEAIRPLAFWESMICGAISRSVAQTTMHPANTMKTLLQNSAGISGLELLAPKNLPRLWVGAGANFLLSVPHGAVNFAVLELVRKQLGAIVQATPFLAEREQTWGAGLDFLSSSISTIACSVVSTPQMMITDNIMAGNYQNLPTAIRGLAQTYGVRGFYAGWWPGLVGKIPSYALTWTLYQRIKKIRDRISDHVATDFENSAMGCIASATTVCLMIPMVRSFVQCMRVCVRVFNDGMLRIFWDQRCSNTVESTLSLVSLHQDTIKTRLVTQAGRAASDRAYKGIIDCAIRVAREEGMGAFYRGLPPRLVSVVPMIGIQ